MLWLIIAVFSYLISAIVSLVDKYLLTKTTLIPKVYAFYVGVLQILILFLIPFVDFSIPNQKEIFLGLLSGMSLIVGIYFFFKALQFSEASRAIPAVGGLTPLFSLSLVYIFSFGKESLLFSEIIAFLLLILGSVLINIEKGKIVNLKTLKFSLPAAFFLALSFISLKYFYSVEPFWNGLIWRSIGSFFVAIYFFIFFPEIKKEIFKKNTFEKNKELTKKKTFFILILNQIAGAGSNILQSWAIFLAPIIYVPFVHALQGIQYVFVLIFAIFLSFKLPQILKEEVSKNIIFQKILAILLIVLAFILIALK